MAITYFVYYFNYKVYCELHQNVQLTLNASTNRPVRPCKYNIWIRIICISTYNYYYTYKYAFYTYPSTYTGMNFMIIPYPPRKNNVESINCKFFMNPSHWFYVCFYMHDRRHIPVVSKTTPAWAEILKIINKIYESD